MRLSFLSVVVAALAVTARAVVAGEYTYFHENVLGTSMELRVVADTDAAAASAEARVLAEIDRLTAVFSSYDPASEFSRWQSTRAVPVKLSPELVAVLTVSDRWRKATSGAFDPRVDVISRLWTTAAKEGREPSADRITAARVLMSRPAWKLDPARGTGERLSECPLTLNAIAKGEIVERASALALDPAHGVRGVFLAIGGDMRVRGEFTRTVDLADPSHDSETTEPIARVALRDKALASSGSYQRGFRVNGRWYSHIIDPRTGTPAQAMLGTTVIADRAADADALATAFCVLKPEESLRLADSLPGVACLLVAGDGKVFRSSGWPKFETAAPVLATDSRGQASKPISLAQAATWGDSNEVLVKFEINRPAGDARRLRRPYVAVWVEDKEGVPVRTLTLWLQTGGPGPRWHPDLKLWYRGDQMRKLVDDTNLIATVARATRPPGKYDVIWDGKDDQGKPLDPGSYTISIEAAREHGTYQVIRKEVTVGDKPFREELKGNVEIKSASVELRRKPAPR